MAETIAKPPRRWFRFSLRTLFVAMTVLGIALGWVAHSLSWISERHQFLSERGPHVGDSLLEQMEAQNVFISVIRRDTSTIPTTRTAAAPGWLSLFGEEGVAQLHVNEPSDLEAAKRLFPEATIVRP